MQHTHGRSHRCNESLTRRNATQMCAPTDQTEWSACSACWFLRGIALRRLMERRCPAKRSKGGDGRGRGRGRGRKSRRGVGRLRRYAGGGWLQLRRIGEVDASSSRGAADSRRGLARGCWSKRWSREGCLSVVSSSWPWPSRSSVDLGQAQESRGLQRPGSDKCGRAVEDQDSDQRWWLGW